jgi:hypothetical protein
MNSSCSAVAVCFARTRSLRQVPLIAQVPLFSWLPCTINRGAVFCRADRHVSTTKTDKDNLPTNAPSPQERQTKPFAIPAPTWSIESLQLNQSHKPASMEELHLLAKRSVLDLRRFDEKSRNQLCQDLGNMLHMIENVKGGDKNSASSSENIVIDPVELYDIPRGVSEAPFRDDDKDTINDHEKNTNDDEQYSRSVRESFLEPKMKRVGGYQYYEIVTSVKRTTTDR